MTNPYEVKETYEVKYVGFADDFYCFRLALEEHGGLDACNFQMEVSQWLFDTTQGDWHMGNDFPYADHPKINLHNTNNVDYFVLLRSLADVAMFEHAFPVTGLSPTMLI